MITGQGEIIKQPILTLPGRPITKKNHQQILVNRQTGKPFIDQSPQYKQYEEECLWRLLSFRAPRYSGKLIMRARYWMPDRRSWPDLFNLLQSTADILQKAHIIDNDRDIVRVDGSEIVGVDKENPRVEIEISEMEG
jgi:Holliday junction resolvase RusA-like endonuclease